MRLSGPLRTVTAFCLLALLGALGTGLPSHHHEGHGSHLDRTLSVTDGDHHSHGAQLVEQEDRTTSGSPHIAVAASGEVHLTPPAGPTTEANDAELPRPTDRAPPPSAPRAPPSD